MLESLALHSFGCCVLILGCYLSLRDKDPLVRMSGGPALAILSSVVLLVTSVNLFNNWGLLAWFAISLLGMIMGVLITWRLHFAGYV